MDETTFNETDDLADALEDLLGGEAHLPKVESFDARIVKAYGEDNIWTVNAMAQVTIKNKDGTYKKTAVNTNDPEMFFKHVYTGKKGEYIYCFFPVDSRPYASIEIPESKVFGLIDGFQKHVLDAIGCSDAKSIAMARSQINVAVKKAEGKRRAERDAAIQKKAAASYADNPLWGAF